MNKNSKQNRTDNALQELKWRLYKTHIGFFWRHRERILAEPRYFHTPTPLSVYLVGRVRFGILLRAWIERPDVYTRPCKQCGGTMVIYSFAGSPMSGCCSRSYACVDCGVLIEHDADGHFGTMMMPIRTLTETHPPQPGLEALTLESLISELEKQNWQLYKTHIGFFWRHRERILAEPRYFHTPTALRVYLVGRVRFGILLRAWIEQPDVYTRPCKQCGGTMVIYSFAGSPLSGRSSRSYACVDCGVHLEHDTNGHFGSMMMPIRTLTEAHPPQPGLETLTLETLISELETWSE